mmetsp:Transcript_132799/g.424896  ORF Transcript_132799/g.424896 Transcript_132799/m.424896 type:complete len:539 (+) Transcript_132799:161-1777(+)
MAGKKRAGAGATAAVAPKPRPPLMKSLMLLAGSTVLLAWSFRWVRDTMPTEPGWAQDPNTSVHALFEGALCTFRRVTAASLGGRLPVNYSEPLIITGAIGGCGEQCVREWSRRKFVHKFGSLPMATASQLGVAFFGPNADDGHRHGWPGTLADAVAAMERATAAHAPASASNASGASGEGDETCRADDPSKCRNGGGQDGRDDPFAFDGSVHLMKSLMAGTAGWQGEPGRWWPDQFAEITGRPILSMGASRAGLPFHDHEAAFLWLVHGRKYWLALPPGKLPDDVPKAGHGQTTWSWLTPDGALRLPTATGSLSELKQCLQRPGEVMFVPRRWYHATMNVGIALGFGGQGGRHNIARPLSEVETDIMDFPEAVHFHLEKVALLPDPTSKMKVLRAADKVQPESYEVWMKLLEVAAELGDLEELSSWSGAIQGRLQQMEDRGALSPQQVSVVLSHLFAAVLEKPASQQSRKAVELVRTALQGAVDRWEGNDYALFYLGAALAMGGRSEEAVGVLERCLKVKPKHDKARTMLASLKAPGR